SSCANFGEKGRSLLNRKLECAEIARLVGLQAFAAVHFECRQPTAAVGKRVDGNPAGNNQRHSRFLWRMTADDPLPGGMRLFVAGQMSPPQPLRVLVRQRDAGFKIGMNEQITRRLPMFETGLEEL